MVSQFEHMSVDQGPSGKFDYLGLDLVVLKKRSIGGRRRWWKPVGTACTGTTTTSLVVSRFGDDDPDYWAASAKALATILHGMRGTPFVYQGEELERRTTCSEFPRTTRTLRP